MQTQISVFTTSLRRQCRRSLLAASAGLLAGTTLTFVPTGAQAAPAPTTVQVSVRTGGFAPGDGANNAASDSERRVVSADGRYVVMSASGPLVPGHVQLRWQIVLRDRLLGTSTLISKSSAGVPGDGSSSAPSISADGQVIAFHSHASNLVAGDTNGTSDVFVHDVRTGTTTRASVTSAGAQVPTGQIAGDNAVGSPSISADGRWVGFTSRVQGYTDDDGDDNRTKAYLHDRLTAAIEVVSRDHSTGAVGGAHAGTAVSVSADGTRVAFQSGDHLVPGSSSTGMDIYVRDRAAGTTTAVGGSSSGTLRHTLSADGRFVAFDSPRDDIVAGDSNGHSDVFVHDLQTHETTRVSIASDGAQGNGASGFAGISTDGRYVTFRSEATNLVAGDTNGHGDVFRHDRSTGQTTRVSLTAGDAQNNAAATHPAISGDGQHITFESYSRVLTSADTRGYGQVFVRDLIGRYPALHARIGALPARVWPNKTHRISTYDIRTGPNLEVTWTPTGGTRGKPIRHRAGVSGNTFALRTPGLKRSGRYVVSVAYSGHTLGSRTIEVRKPRTKKLPKSIAHGGKLTIRTLGVDRGQKVQVRLQPRGKTRGNVVKRTAKANRKGVLKVRPAPRRGTYQVVVRSQGQVLGKGLIRIR